LPVELSCQAYLFRFSNYQETPQPEGKSRTVYNRFGNVKFETESQISRNQEDLDQGHE